MKYSKFLLLIIFLSCRVGATMVVPADSTSSLVSTISFAGQVAQIDGTGTLNVTSGTITDTSSGTTATIGDDNATTSGAITINNSATISRTGGAYAVSVGRANNNHAIITNSGTINSGGTAAINFSGSSSQHSLVNTGAIGIIDLTPTSGATTGPSVTITGTSGTIGNLAIGSLSYLSLNANGSAIGSPTFSSGSLGGTINLTAGSIGTTTIEDGTLTLNASGGAIGNLNFSSGAIGNLEVSGGTAGDVVFVDGSNTVTISSSGTIGAVTFGSGNDTLNLAGGTIGAVDFSTNSGSNILNVASNSTIGSNLDMFATDGTSTATVNISLGQGTPLTIANNTLTLNNATINIIAREDEIENISNGDIVIIDASAIGATYTNFTGISQVNSISNDHILFGTPSIDGNGSLVIPVEKKPLKLFATSPNTVPQSEVLTSIESSSNYSSIVGQIRRLPLTKIDNALSQLAPSANSITNESIIQSNTLAQKAVEIRTNILRAGLHTETRGYMSADVEPYGASFWMKPLATVSVQKNLHNFFGYNNQTYGLAFGVDKELDKNLWLGSALSVARSNVDTKTYPGNNIRILSVLGAIYSGYQGKSSFFDGAIQLGFNNYKSIRNISIGNINNSAYGNYNGWQFSGKIRYGFNNDALIKNLIVSKVLGLSYFFSKSQGYEETGAGSLSLKVNKSAFNQVMVNLGAQLARKNFGPGKGVFYPDLHAYLLIDLTRERGKSISKFIGGGNSFTTSGRKPELLGLNIGAAVTVIKWNRFHLSLEYDLITRRKYKNHSASLVFRNLF